MLFVPNEKGQGMVEQALASCFGRYNCPLQFWHGHGTTIGNTFSSINRSLSASSDSISICLVKGSVG